MKTNTRHHGYQKGFSITEITILVVCLLVLVTVLLFVVSALKDEEDRKEIERMFQLP